MDLVILLEYIKMDVFFSITEKVMLSRIHELLKKEVIITEHNKRAISQFLRGRRNWNYVVLKSIRE